MYAVPKINQCCATCNHWQGPREKTCYGVETGTNSVYGRCAAGVLSPVTSGHMACEGQYCKKFEKWRAL